MERKVIEFPMWLVLPLTVFFAALTIEGIVNVEWAWQAVAIASTALTTGVCVMPLVLNRVFKLYFAVTMEMYDLNGKLLAQNKQLMMLNTALTEALDKAHKEGND